ncbi:MAG: ECF-type sigma factor, partial [Planctomycetota bacterium]
RGNSIFVANGSQTLDGDFDRFQHTEETPSKKEIAAERIQQLLDKLKDAMLRTILVLRYEGFTNEEISEQLKVSIATVERKRRRIRELLSEDYPSELTAP